MVSALVFLIAAITIPLMRNPAARRAFTELSQFRGQACLLDERLTMSARLAAATGDVQWEARYRQAESELNAILGQSDAVLDSVLGADAVEARAGVHATSAYNEKLITLENACFELVRQGEKEQAFRTVHSPDYERLKVLYAAAVERSDAAITNWVRRAVERDEQLAIASALAAMLAAAVTILGMLLLARALAQHTNALSASEARLRTLTNTIPGVAYRCRADAARTALFVSEGVRSISARAPADFLGSTGCGLASLIHAEDRADVLARIATAIAERRPYVLEYRVARADGETRHVWERGVPVFERASDTAPAYLDGVFLDATQSWLAQQEIALARDEAQSASKTKAEFLANMSHEIRTPMNAVIGMTGLLLETPLNAEQRELADTVQRSADALLVLINDILDFSKLEAGKLELETQDFDPADVVEDVASMLRHRANEKGVELTFEVTSDVPNKVCGDAGRVRQVLINLASNALKFTAQGTVALHAAVQELQEHTVVVRFSVQDTGIGIPADRTAQLFRPFVQVDSSTSRRFGGTGLGLAICRQLVELMRGKIGCDSHEGSGSCFWFTLPFPRVHAAAREDSGAFSSVLCRKHILIVDDNATNRRILVEQLTSRGACVTGAASGAAALELLRERASTQAPFDCGILDLLMPEMDGVELARALRAERADFPLVLLTSSVSRGDTERFREAGIGAWLSKPTRPERIVEAVLAATSAPALPTQAASMASLESHASRSDDGRRTQVRILIADDNQVNQRVAQKMLERIGYRSDVVANGREAIEALGRVPYDLIFMDCQMPELDGLEATRLIRAGDIARREVRIIALTANAMAGDQARCIAAGMNDYLTKPFKLQALADAVQRNLPRIAVDEPAPALPASAEARQVGVDESI